MKKVVIADDSIAFARQLEKIIAGSGEFEVVAQARNGLEAIQMYQLHHPDILCMDMNMPGMDGITALRTLVALDKQAKVVMITSLGGVGDKFTEALRLGAKAVLSKPFEPEELLKVLREL
ncbi:MAG: two-component system response regulator [Geobacteraceae bacterium GWC2_58_44]|nr:MAG: two-component system response regulator [Geobacteraceae bacterium GWC2_58_44]HBG08231.1 two-component system response regulator [Geobacter sp.]